MKEDCFHCGLSIPKGERLDFDNKAFCCTGCRAVYTILRDNGLAAYYEMEKSPGASPKSGRSYEFLDNEDIVRKLLTFDEDGTAVVSFHIPHIHCSSCIWILENLHRLDARIRVSTVNFPRKRVSITFDKSGMPLREVAELLAKIGYEPHITLDDYGAVGKKADRSLTIKLGVAFFAFGNIMLLSFPEYLDADEFWLDRYKGFLRFLIFLLALPSFLYSASGYYTAAYRSLKAGFLSIEVPIALGIVIMFVRSVADMWLNHGPGFFDSMAGLIFFMLLGKMFQSKTYAFLSFERDYRSYFPIAVTRILPGGREESVPVYQIGKGDELLVRNLEIIPADGTLASETAAIDYSFVTGEATLVEKKKGDGVFAGGKHIGPGIRVTVQKPVSQSYLTQLWEHDVFHKKSHKDFTTATDRISRYFTPALLGLAILGFGYWIIRDSTTAFDVFTAVLIVACPCALALTAPFTLGNILRIMGRNGFYLKNAQVIEQLAAADTIVFDKTGTLTSTRQSHIGYEGAALDEKQLGLIRSTLRASNHPLSRMLYESLPTAFHSQPDEFFETAGEGIEARFGTDTVRIGSASFTQTQASPGGTKVYVTVNAASRGSFAFRNRYRPGVDALFSRLTRFRLKVLSGDNAEERSTLQQRLPQADELVFGYKPQEKLGFIKKLQEEGHRVIMVGDGLNDAGALAQSNAGIAISEDINVFSPACDAILDATAFGKLDRLLLLSRRAILVIRLSFAISLLYNAVGLYFALTGQLSPLFAAVIMPLSTVTIISFVTVLGNFFARLAGLHEKSKKSAKGERVTNVIFSSATPV